MAGLPCVSTAVGGTPEVIVDGQTGLLARPGDPEGVAAKLAVLLADSNLRQSMGAAGRAEPRAVWRPANARGISTALPGSDHRRRSPTQRSCLMT
jgi:glycosyltransferase involved in cell wall biosynthesis